MYLTIETERLKLRPIAQQDAAFMVQLLNSKAWLKYIGDRNVSNKEEAKHYIRHILNTEDFYYSVFELKETRQAIGIISFMKRADEKFPDLGFALLPTHEKKGYALEAAKAYLEHLTSTKKYKQIIAITLPNNQQSIALLGKLDFHFIGESQKENNLLTYYGLKLDNAPG